MKDERERESERSAGERKCNKLLKTKKKVITRKLR